ncbi:MAG: Xylose isomerase-like barrel [Armatimonadetes bacterium]|jgi:sugar phosphate isomerase/epimerase|nr:Xylose isomerase-like barrel [Armatimonadota bacterium]
MSFVTLGTVSNGWAGLLASTTLAEQCRRATELGFGYVELRQGALGECEERVEGDGRAWPLPSALAGLRAQAPGLGFNLAVEAPFQTSVITPDDPYLGRCLEAAVALGGAPPVLRLVDLSPAEAVLDADGIDRLGQSIAELARRAWRLGVVLSLENCKQPVRVVRALIERAAVSLPEEVPVPTVCWDSHNQIVQRLEIEDPVDTARTIGVDELFEFHFKQSHARELLPDVTGPGDLDWHEILQALHDRGYQGPALFELPPGPDIWDRLARSTAYIQELIEKVETR